MEEIKLFAPATIANISCGFDVLGLCLENVGDEMIIRKTNKKGVKITKIIGQDLPLETEKNVAGVAVLALLKKLNCNVGFGVNKLLGEPFSIQELVPFAMEGEKLASGTAHADNVAPALLGGFTLIRSYSPLDIIKINAPSELYATVIHPQIEVKTADARSVLKQTVSLKHTVPQLGNLGGLISGLYTENYELIGRSLHDEIVEPYRSILIPEFENAKKAALEVGALGSGISGSGPSIFALCKGKETAEKVAKTMASVYNNIAIDFDVHVSKVNANGIKIL